MSRKNGRPELVDEELAAEVQEDLILGNNSVEKPTAEPEVENSNTSKRVPLLEIAPQPRAKLNGRKRKANQSDALTNSPHKTKSRSMGELF